MRKVVLKSLSIISIKEKKAKNIDFDEHLTVLTSTKDNESENHTGKSLVIKSIYYSLGATLSKYTMNWKNLNIVTILKFLYDEQIYQMFRLGDSFVFESKDYIKRFQNISELKEFYSEFFDIKLKLLRKNDTLLHTPYPDAIFTPFYIDQDTGWSGNWKSFQSVAMYSNPYKEIFSYYVGLRTKEYYEMLLEKEKNNNIILDNKEKKSLLNSILQDNYRRYDKSININIDIDTLKIELDNLIEMLNDLQIEKNILREKLIEKNNSKIELENNLNNVKYVMKELSKDFDFVNSEKFDDSIVCPICGVVHKNDLNYKYMIQMDIAECADKLGKYTKDYNKTINEINEIKNELNITINKYININNILNQKKDTIKLKDILTYYGINQYINDLHKDIGNCDYNINEMNEKIKEINKNIKKYTKSKNYIEDDYNTNVNNNIINLEVTDIELSVKKKVGENIKAGGADLPRALLASLFAYYNLMKNNEEVIIFPIVIDTPLQQDPSSKSISSIFKLFSDEKYKDFQMVLATTDAKGENFQGNIYNFMIKNKLLSYQDYSNIEAEMIKFINLLSE